MSAVAIPLRAGQRVPAPAGVRRLAEWMLFLLFAGQGVRNLAGWQGFLVLAGAMAAYVAWSLWRHRRDERLLHLPPELIAFLLFSSCSLVWSHYQWATVLGLLGQWSAAAAGVWLAISLSWREMLEALSSALVRVLTVSIAFELFVAVVVRNRLAPLGLDVDPDTPGAFFWSENRLFTGGPIQGIVGNRNLLAFVALLLLIALIARLVAGDRSRALAFSTALAVVTLLMTRSATVVAVAACIGMLVGVVIFVIRITHPARRLLQSVVLAGLALGLAGMLSMLPVALGLIGRSDLTNRVEIWRIVLGLVEERPALGWGWVSYWAPWVHPFDGLIEFDGVEYLQAHNALLDVLLQLGVVGAALAVVAAIAAVVRGWAAGTASGEAGSIFPGWWPLLMLCALLMQALTESRLLIEGHWALFVALSVKLAVDQRSRASKAPFTATKPATASIAS